MKLMFKNDYYKQKAFELSLSNNDKKRNYHNVFDAFLLLIKGIKISDLNNLCILIKEYYNNISINEAYLLTQGESIPNKIVFNDSVKENIYLLAKKCIESGKHLGNNTINDGNINTSSWISHSLFSSILASQLANAIGLDSKKIESIALLHDIGRKQTHTFEHTIRGFEMLIDANYETEAIGCITHSFLGGGRCSSNELAEPGFFVDDNGIPHFKDGAFKDDITIFLENYKYTMYDIILNITDLMATDKGIVSPMDRIKDIESRRKSFDPANRNFFLAEFTNYLVLILKIMERPVPKVLENKLYAKKGISTDEIMEKLKIASDLFYNEYIEQCKIQFQKKK